MIRKLLCCLMVSTAALAAWAAPNENNDTVIVVTVNPPMHCNNCEKKIKSNIRFVKGVKNIDTNIGKQTVTIKADKKKLDLTSLEKNFEKIGYHIESVNK